MPATLIEEDNRHIIALVVAVITVINASQVMSQYLYKRISREDIVVSS